MSAAATAPRGTHPTGAPSLSKVVDKAVTNRAVVDSPFAPGQDTLWTRVIAQNKKDAKDRGDASARPDAACFVVGAARSGKSTLVSRFLFPDKRDAPKPTEGMEYNYARKTHATNVERKDVAHVWEIAGSRRFADACTEQDNVFMGMRHVTTAVVVIVLDLSRPHEALPTLEYWLERVKCRTRATFAKLEKRGSKLPEQLRTRSAKTFGQTHEDVGHVRHLGVTVVVVAAKYDAFERADAELKKIMSRALRHACHAHGASLFYTSGLDAAAAATGGGEDETSTVASRRARSADDREDDARRLNRFRAYLNHLVFVGADKRYPGRIDPEIDYGGAITVVAGSDRFASIGAPRGASGGASGGDASAAWRALFREAFPPPNGDGGTWVGGGFGSDDGGDVKNRGCPDLGKYPEREVDAERERKAEELASFRKRQAMMKSGGSAVASAAATLRAKVKSGGGAASSRSSSSASAAPVSSSRSSASAASAPSRERSSATGSAAARPSSARSASGVASSRLNSGRTSARGGPAAPSSARRPTMR